MEDFIYLPVEVTYNILFTLVWLKFGHQVQKNLENVVGCMSRKKIVWLGHFLQLWFL